jgi:hypothetical protein
MAILDIEQVLANIADTLKHEMDGGYIARIHNEICAKKIRYSSDSTWDRSGMLGRRYVRRTTRIVNRKGATHGRR